MVPEDVADGDPSHDVHHNQLHDLYNYVDGLADGRVIVGAATPGVGTDLNLTTEPWISDADDISDTSTTNKFTTAAEISKLAGIEAGATADQTGAQIKTAYEAESDTNAFDDAAVAKLAGIEASADVTDATNVNAAGAVMTSDASTAGMGFVVDEDNMVSDSSTKVPTQQSVKQYVDNSVAFAGGGDMLSTQNLADLQNATTARQNLGVAIGTNVQAHNSVLDTTTASFTTADQSKLDGIEAAADVTDTANVTAAGALMDSEVDADIKTLSLPASTTISTFGASLVDDADATAARATLGVPSALDDLSDVTSSAPSDAQVLAWNAPNSDWRPTTFTVPAVLDEDNMATNSATAVPSQQSVKAYVDAEVAGVGGGEPSRSNTTHSATGTLAITTAAAKRHVVTTSNGNNISGYNLTYPPSGDVDIDLWILAPPSGSITVDLSVTPSASFLQEGTFTGTLTAGDAPFIIKIDRIG